MTTILDQFGRPVKREKTPERRPLAAAPLHDAWRDYVAAGLKPETLAAVFKEADAGDVRRQAELFEQIEEKDGHLLGEKTKRQNVILDVSFEVKPASEDARDKRVAEFVEDYLSNMTDYADVLVSLQDAVGKGYAALEIAWDVSEGQAMPGGLEFIEQKRFLFTDPAGVLRKYPLLITDDAPMGIEIPAFKVLFHRYGGKSGHPTRSGIYRVAAWMYLFKNYAIKDWVIFCEIFGMPLRLGKYDSGASKADKDALIAAISSLGTDAAGIISKSTEIEFVDKVQRTASADLYKMLADFCNRENSKAILGQTLSAEVGDKGSYAAAKTHEGVRLDLLKADARALAATIRHQLIRPLVGYNFGWDTPVPKYEAVFEEDREIYEYHLKYGVLTINEVRKKLNLPPIDGGDVLISPAKDDAGEVQALAAKLDRIVAKSTRFSAEQERVEGLVARTLAEAAGAMSGLTGPIRDLVARAGSLEEIRDGIVATYADMDPTGLEELIARALFAAELYGRLTVEETDA